MAAILTACSGVTGRRTLNSPRVLRDSFFDSSDAGVPSTLASCARSPSDSLSSFGRAHRDSTGVLIASSWPWRSDTWPRCAGRVRLRLATASPLPCR